MTERGYVLVNQQVGLDPSESILVLAQAAKQGTFLDELSADPRKKDQAAAIMRAASRLARNGTEWAIASETLKLLDGGLALFELRAKRKVWRVMAYVHDDAARTPVLLFAFDAHKSKKAGGIRTQDMKRAKSFARIARELMKQEEQND